MEYKFRIDFDENNVLESVTYTLVSKFNLKPNVLRADIGGDGAGYMLLGIEGDKDTVEEAMIHILDMGFSVKELNGHIIHDCRKCWHCGACVSLCPTKALYVDSEMRIQINGGTCIACGGCIDGCAVKAIQLEL
ncbi:MAG: 4Fe-4S binding protein [Candidatus Methanomethylophilaceae archaeon]|nr:4Fe-4S binding protein [Candidatus Methanomethylophilaceae archaeon]